MEVVYGTLAALLCLAAAVACWRMGRRLGRRLAKGPGEAAAAGALLFTLALIGVVRWNSARLPPWVVLSPLVYLEFAYFLPTLALFLGLASARVPRPETVKALRWLAGVVACYSAFHLWLTFDAWTLPELSSLPPPGPVQGQTTKWSCGAASCVNLLRAHGIASTEREMGELCLTLPVRGTTTPRFVRGLTLKLRREGSPLRVRAEEGLDVAGLDEFPRPCLLGIRGSILVGHAVVLTGRTPEGKYRIADPLGGGTLGDLEPADLRRMFTGDAIALVP